MKHLSWTLLLIAATLTACSSDDDNEPQNPAAATTQVVPQPETRLMYVDVSESPLTDEAEARQEGTTRAAETTTSSLSEFFMNYTADYSYTFTKKDGKWDTNSWPNVGDDEKIDFYAQTYDKEKFCYNSGDPYVSFTVEELASKQHDLLVAEHKNISKSDASGHVSLHFYHACAAVNFRIGQSKTLSNNSVTFTSIAITGIYNHGEYHYNTTPKWKDITGNATYTLESASSIEIPVSTAGSNEGARELTCGYLFMIPQAHDVTITIGYTFNETAKTADITLPVDWQAGYKYTIDIRLGTNTIK